MSRRERVAGLLRSTGLLSVLDSLARRNVIAVLNYHRIGRATETPYDPGLYSATPEEFDEQIQFFQRFWGLATLAETVDAVERGRSDRPLLLITFDDGYLDNYQWAYPVLKNHGAQGVFFLASGYIGTGRIPWWDSIGWMLAATSRDRIRLSYPDERTVELNGRKEAALRDVLRLYKSPANTDPDRFLTEVSEACGVAPPPPDPGLFMNWEQAAAMVAGGMALGGHTVSHPLLAKLPPGEQMEELAQCKRAVEERTRTSVTALAYPVGNRLAFNADTKAAAEACGYRLAFSYYGGVNRVGSIDRWNVRRMPVEAGMSVARIRFELAVQRLSHNGED